MRFHEFKLTEQQLDELKMSPSSLGAFAKSPVAKGIKAGFEAEMVFPGLADPDAGEMEPDYDADERAHSIDDIIDFFSNDEYGFGAGNRTLDRLRDDLQEAYWEYADEQLHYNFREEGEQLIREYIEENDFDTDDYIHSYLTDELGLTDSEADDLMTASYQATSTKDLSPQFLEARKAADAKLDELAEESFDSQDGTYDTVLENYREDYEYPEEREFLRANEMEWMTEVSDRYSIDWPIWTNLGSGEGGYSENAAEELARDLSRTLGVETKVSGGYHSQRKNDTHWYFEPDGSLDADDEEDMPVEIVSPPMELEECLNALEDFFSWAKGHNAYTNKSTGFHMGVSLPNVGGKVDFVKLALFLGDEYVLQSFGRQAVAFTESAMKKMRNRIKGNDDRVSDAMNLMRKGLIDIAHNTIASDEGFGKYTSINPKGDYIEFRSAGNKDYQADISKLRNTLLRYAQAMVVAADPALEKQEYYKKLYKLIAPATGDSSMDLFARFASGSISKEELKNQWASAALSQTQPSDVEKPDRRAELAKRIQKGKGDSTAAVTPDISKYNYYIRDVEANKIVHLFNATDNDAALAVLKRWKETHPGDNRYLFGETRRLQGDEPIDLQPLQPQQAPQAQQPQQATAPNGVPEWEIYQTANNQTLHRFADHTQTSAWSTAQAWARENGWSDNMHLLSVRPVQR